MFDYFMDVEYVVCGELHCWGTPCIREVCIIEMSTFKIWTYHVKICSKVEDMSEKDKRTALYVKKNINGLNPYIWSSYTCFRLIDEFKTYFERNKNFRIAYKGGIYEKKLIEHFGCNSLDVEKYPFCVPPISPRRHSWGRSPACRRSPSSQRSFWRPVFPSKAPDR